MASVFGSEGRDRVLMAVAAVGQTYPRELAAALDLPLLSVQRVVNALQRDGLLVSRMLGRVRIVEMNTTWYGARELRALIERMVEANPSRIDGIYHLRRRPRRAGKPL